MATLQNVLDASIARYIDPDKTTWADAELTAYANKAQDYLNQILIRRNDPMAIKSATFSLVDGTETYSLPSDFIAMWPGPKPPTQTGIWIVDNFLQPVRETERINYVDADEAEPLYYYITTTTCGFLPVPDTSYTATYRYFYTPAALAVSSTMPWGGVFNEAISMFITNMANARIQQDVSMAMDLYNELERQALGVLSVRTPIRPRLVNRRR